jgi:hypothetical protein
MFQDGYARQYFIKSMMNFYMFDNLIVANFDISS